MKSVFRATAILSAGTFGSMFFRMLSTKVMAVVLQPVGVGYFALLQSFSGMAGMVAGMGIGTGLVRQGASPVANDDQMTIASLRRASWLLAGTLSILALLILLVARVPLSRLALGNAKYATTILLLWIALPFAVASGIQSSTLNAYHRVAALAKGNVIGTVLSSGCVILCLLFWGIQGAVAAVICAAIAGCVVVTYFAHRDVGPVKAQPKIRDVLRSARSLLQFGGPYTASMLVGTGTHFLAPIIVLHVLGTASVGYLKAAGAISTGCLGFLVTSMAQDYYPRLSAAKDHAPTLVNLINEQHRLVMIIMVPVVLATLALLPYLVPILFSRKFLPAVEILEWTLIGDLFKFSSWTMSFIILARCKSSVFFLSESILGVANVATLWLGIHWFGLPGLGIGFLASYIIYYGVVWVIVRRQIPLVWTASNKLMLLGSVAAALLIRLLSSTGLANLRTPIALALALLAGAWSLRAAWGEWSRPAESKAV